MLIGSDPELLRSAARNNGLRNIDIPSGIFLSTLKLEENITTCVVSGPTQWRDWKSSLSSMRMTNLGGWSSARTVGRGSSASRRGRTTVRVIGGDPIGSRRASEPDGGAKSSE